ncbi:LOW QUALITY PROTEIN: hypothetical protein Cgig2_013306 [Carnegiea gigantea]|uniref:Uncharacterized protein n=1 Tax=Carnegiea gigantea TaxID=171969 RepID=A0A9Q1GZP3_9CARY|nr:LOW QUALITY PROTEIN: hypothetical protein Cgig2_013306 [Carnegiea gigantea]
MGGECELDDGGGGKVMYVKGWMKCMLLKKDMGLEEVRRKVSEITGIDLTVQKLWYSLKYDRGMVMDLEGDGDVRMFIKGNDEHGYLYMGESNGLKRHTVKAMRTCEEGVVHVRSGRDRDDIVQQVGYGAGVKMADVRGSGECSDDHPQTRVRVGEEVIEMSDDDEISVVSEDMGEDEAAVQGGEESSQVKANLWVYDYVHPIYKTATQQIIYNQLVHPMETHDMGTVDAKTGRVVSGDELDDDYDRYILPPTNERQSVGHTRRTYRNLHADFDANYEGDIMEVEALLDGSLNHIRLQSTDVPNWQILLHFALCSYCIVSCEHSPSLVCASMTKSSFWCCLLSGNLKCLPGRRLMFTVVKHGVQPVTCYVNPVRGRYRPWYTMVCKWYTTGKHYRCQTVILCLHYLLSYHHTPTPVCVFRLKFKFIVHGAGRFTPVCVLIIKYRFALVAGVRYSAMFTQGEAYVYRGKPWCASSTSMEN